MPPGMLAQCQERFGQCELSGAVTAKGLDVIAGIGGRQTGFWRTRVVVSQREGEHDGEPKNRTDDDELSALGTVAGVHEVENNEGSLDRGDGESDDNIEFTKILECGPNGDGGAEHQGHEDDDVNSRRYNVLGHARLLQTLLPVPVNQI